MPRQVRPGRAPRRSAGRALGLLAALLLPLVLGSIAQAQNPAPVTLQGGPPAQVMPSFPEPGLTLEPVATGSGEPWDGAALARPFALPPRQQPGGYPTATGTGQAITIGPGDGGGAASGTDKSASTGGDWLWGPDSHLPGGSGGDTSGSGGSQTTTAGSAGTGTGAALNTAGAWVQDFSNGPGTLDNTWGNTSAVSYNGGVLRIEGPTDRDGYAGQAGVMGATGAPDSWFGYGLYQFHIRYSGGLGDGSGPAVGLWAADNRWPDGEIDLGEIDSSGRLYFAQHWQDPVTGEHQFALFYPPAVDWTQWHTTAVLFEPGKLTFYLDGQVVGTTTQNVVPAYQDGGVNRIPFIMNRSAGTVAESDWMSFTPLQQGGSTSPRRRPGRRPLPGWRRMPGGRAPRPARRSSSRRHGARLRC